MCIGALFVHKNKHTTETFIKLDYIIRKHEWVESNGEIPVVICVGKGLYVLRNGRLNGRVCADDTKKTLWYNRIVPQWVVKPGMNAEYCPKEC